MLSVLNMTNTKMESNDDHCILHGHTLEEEDMQDNGMTKAEIRKSNKPIMEKRRRARINTCLNELKSLILDALKKDPARHSKLEKADILEMTVKHLQMVQRQQLAVAVARDPAVLNKFKGGFSECAQEVTRYISRIDGVDAGVRHRLLQHLSNCSSGLNATTPLSFTTMAGLPISANVGVQQQPPSQQQGDLNSSQARLLHRFVAARLVAAGDTAGAALLLQGGFSLLARGAPPPPPQPQPCPPPPPPPQKLPPKVLPPLVNDGASSSRDPTRVSAFTAVRRSSSPPRVVIKELPPQKVLAPTAIRPVPRSASTPKTLVQAQVALKPVSIDGGEDLCSPVDFSFRRNSFGIKRTLEEPLPYPIPSKVLRMGPPHLTPTAYHQPPHYYHSPSSRSQNVRQSTSLSPPTNPSSGSESSPENATDGEDKDMWRPW